MQKQKFYNECIARCALEKYLSDILAVQGEGEGEAVHWYHKELVKPLLTLSILRLFR